MGWGRVVFMFMTVVTAMLSDEVNWVRGTLYQAYHLPSALYCQMNCHWSALLLCDTMLTSRGTVAVISFNKVATFYLNSKKWGLNEGRSRFSQGCINCSSLPAGLGARGVSSEHVENMENAEKMKNMEMFSGSPLRCSPVLQLRCALVLGEPCSGSRRTVNRKSRTVFLAVQNSSIGLIVRPLVGW